MTTTVTFHFYIMLYWYKQSVWVDSVATKMSSNRRLNLRKNKKSDKDSNQSISNFVQRRSKDDAEVEIVVDDDDVQEVGDQVF